MMYRVDTETYTINCQLENEKNIYIYIALVFFKKARERDKRVVSEETVRRRGRGAGGGVDESIPYVRKGRFQNILYWRSKV